jgi:4-amino-4-deoxy-L-arabinose transferase-like glycosyltransferase
VFDIETLITGWRPYAALSVLCALLFLPGLNNLPPTDRDEARFMQATKQMLETKDVVTIRFKSDLRTKKPVGIHWLQYAAVKYLADRDLQAVWAYRLPSAVCAWLAVLVTFAFGARVFNRETALTGAAVMACTFLLVAEAHIAKTDAALLLTVVCAQACLYWLYCTPPGHSPPMRLTIGFWMAIGAGLLIKGPITPGIALLTIAVLCIAERRTDWLRRLQPELGVPVAAAFILPWTLASAVAGNGDVIAASLTEDFLPKLLGGVESHGAPPGTHTLLAPLTLWPASLVVLPGLVLAWQRRTEPAMKFLLAWAGATWFLFELTPTKLPHYVLPAVPALCLAAAAAFAGRNLPAWSKTIWSLITVAVSGTLLWATQTYDGPVWLAVTGVALSIALIGWVWRQNTPPLDALSLSTRLRDAVALETVAPDLPVALARYHEPSAVFWMGTHSWLTNARNAAAHIIADPGALAVIAEDQLAEVSAIADAVGGTIVVLTTIDGYNYAKGRSENLILVRSEAKPSQP